MEIVDKLMTKRTYSTKASYEGAVRNALVQMQSHDRGMGDIFKNSKDEYERLNLDKEDCLAILFFKNGTNSNTSKIGFLDFGGMDSEDIEHFSEFHSHSASHRNTFSSDNFFGGKGNGGKLYGLGLFDKAFWYTAKNKYLRAVGFESKIVSAKGLGNVKDKDLRVIHDDYGHFTNSKFKLQEYLKLFNINFEDLPVKIKKIAEKRQSFTFFIGENVKEYPRHIKVQKELDKFITNQQSILPLQLMNIYICNNGRFVKEENNETYKFLKPETIGQHKDQLNQVSIEIPDMLEDPETKNIIDMTNSPFRRLIIKSSAKDMPNSSLKGRHLIVGRKASGKLKAPQGHWKMREVSSNPSGFSRHLYGELFHDELKDYTSNSREEFTPSPFINALSEFININIDKIANEHLEKKKVEIEKKQKENIKNFQRNLEKVFKENGFIKHKTAGEGNLSTNGSGKKKPKYKDNGKLKSMDLTLSHKQAGKGVVFRPKLTSYNTEGKIIKNYSVDWFISDSNVLGEHEKHMNLLFTKNSGTTKIHAVSKKNKIKSNSVEISVLDISKINLKNNFIELKERTSSKINYEILDVNGNKYNSCYLTYTSNNENIIGTSPVGLLSGIGQGETELTAMTEDCFSNSVKVSVKENPNPPKQKGGGFPTVLCSGIDDDPLNEDGKNLLDADHPPIYQRPIDTINGVWWINFQSPLTEMIWKQSNNKKQVSDGEKSAEFKVYYLEQFFEIMARVNITSNPDSKPDTLAKSLQSIDDEKTDFNKKIEPFVKSILNSDDFFNTDE